MSDGYDFVVNIDEKEVMAFKEVLKEAARLFNTIEGLEDVARETLEVESMKKGYFDLSEFRNNVYVRRGLLLLKKGGISIMVD